MKLFGMCINWKVLAGLGAVGVGIAVLAPQLFAAALHRRYYAFLAQFTPFNNTITLDCHFTNILSWVPG